MTAVEHAAALAATARQREATPRSGARLAKWIITRPGHEPYEVILNPPQTQEWVLAHYQGCGVTMGDA